MLRTTRAAAVAAALASTVALAAGAATASADTSISGIPASAPIVNKLYVPVTLTVSCDPNPGFFQFGTLSVTIRQLVSGKNIAHGTATRNNVSCDGYAAEYAVDVFPETTGAPSFGSADSPPFTKGDAVISARISNFYTSAGVDAQTIKLTK